MFDRHTELINNLRIDCSNCSGLCCVALCFSKIDGFPSNKAAGVPCNHLMSDYKCNIYAKLSSMEMKGCTIYDCLGAGQKVSKKIFLDTDWRKNPEIAKDIFQVFLIISQLHQIQWYLLQGISISKDKKLITLIDELIKENEETTSMPISEILKYDLDKYRGRANEAIIKSMHHEVELSAKDFIGKNFKKMNLDGKDFSLALLIGANFEGCSLKGTSFLGADMRDALIMNTDFSNSYFLTQMQINSAKGNNNTKIPFYLTRPRYW
jgi:uncharacterized protein YjbI with pentapeptide repeats